MRHRDVPGHGGWVPVNAAWAATTPAGPLGDTRGAPSGSLQAAHGRGDAPAFCLFSPYVIFESFVQVLTGGHDAARPGCPPAHAGPQVTVGVGELPEPARPRGPAGTSPPIRP